MNQDQWTAVDQYITKLFVPNDPALDAAMRASAAANLPAISVSPSQGKLLMVLARAAGAKNILEIGTLGAYSTIWLARGLARGGRVITLEANEKHAAVARTNLANAGLADVVQIRVAPALQSLPGLFAESPGGFDFIFIDADKANYPEYLKWAIKLSHPGTVIVADNVVRKGAIIDAATTDADILGMRKFNEILAAEPRLAATELQVVGSKGYDGIAIAVVQA